PPPSVLELVATARQISLEFQEIGAILIEPAFLLANLPVESLGVDFFLSNQVHVGADLGNQVLEHIARPLDFELHRHGVANRMLGAADSSADVAIRVSIRQ